MMAAANQLQLPTINFVLYPAAFMSHAACNITLHQSQAGPTQKHHKDHGSMDLHYSVTISQGGWVVGVKLTW